VKHKQLTNRSHHPVPRAAAVVVIVGAMPLQAYGGPDPHRKTNVTYQANLLDLKERSALGGRSLIQVGPL
jgi:hypothetical protein